MVGWLQDPGACGRSSVGAMVAAAFCGSQGSGGGRGRSDPVRPELFGRLLPWGRGPGRRRPTPARQALGAGLSLSGDCRGIPRSSMPAWKGKLSQEEIWSVVAYVMSLSGLEEPGDAGAAAVATPGPEARASVPEETPGLPAPLPETGKPSRGLAGEPDKGRELFFRCGRRPQLRSMPPRPRGGGAVGPDLSGLADRPGREILRISSCRRRGFSANTHSSSSPPRPENT